jgi:uncharacterized protein (TIGR00369 family)
MTAARAPIDRLLGLQPGADGVALPPQPGLMNHRGGVHGGAVMALLEAALREAAAAQGDAWAQGARTRELHVHFMRPGSGPLQARAHITGGGRTLCFGEARVVDGQGQAVAQALATLTPAAPQQPNLNRSHT